MAEIANPESTLPEIPKPWPDYATALKLLKCPPYPDVNNNVPLQKPLPPPGISNAYWNLKLQKFSRPPYPSQFHRTKFLVQEPQGKKPYVPFLSGDHEGILCECYSKKTFSEREKRKNVRQWQTIYRDNLREINEDWEQWINTPLGHIYPPKNKVDFGCERIRELASIAPHAVSTIVRRFVTGPSNKDLYWLRRTEVVECWQRVLTSDLKVNSCCVEAPKYPQVKANIPALRSPSEAKRSTSKSKSTQKKLKTKPTVQKLPPFCPPIPKLSLRMPWHIPPLKPKDGDNRLKFKIERSIDLDDIIPRKGDPYGEDRNKQKYVRTVEMREKMVEKFLMRTELEPESLSTSAIYGLTSQKNFKLNPKSKRDIALAELLAKSEYSNTADSMRRQEWVEEKQRRHLMRGRVPDYSQVRSRYLDLNSMGKQTKMKKNVGAPEQ